MQLIPYKGSSEVVQGLLSGSVDFIIDGAAPSLPLIRSGQFRALAKLNSRPLSQLPDLAPLAAAAGLPGLDDNPVTSTPAEFDAFFRAEARRWTKVFRDSGIRLD